MYRDCARQVGAFLGKLRPCALPQRALHLAQLLWRYLVNSSAVTNYGSHPVHFSWWPPRCSPSTSHFLSCHLSTDNVGCFECRTDVLPALFKISSVFLRAQIMLLLTLALLRFSEQNLQFFSEIWSRLKPLLFDAVMVIEVFVLLNLVFVEI